METLYILVNARNHFVGTEYGPHGELRLVVENDWLGGNPWAFTTYSNASHTAQELPNGVAACGPWYARAYAYAAQGSDPAARLPERVKVTEASHPHLWRAADTVAVAMCGEADPELWVPAALAHHVPAAENYLAALGPWGRAAVVAGCGGQDPDTDPHVVALVQALAGSPGWQAATALLEAYANGDW